MKFSQEYFYDALAGSAYYLRSIIKEVLIFGAYIWCLFHNELHDKRLRLLVAAFITSQMCSNLVKNQIAPGSC